jgi:hypothetical protein
VIRFTLTLLARSFRWVPPTLVLVTWIGIVLADGGPPLANLVAAAPALVVFSMWITIAIGGLDDDAHRDLLAAALGSHAALHRRRAAAAATLGAAAGLIVAGVLAGSARQPGHPAGWVLGAGALLAAAATAAGVAVGTSLHPPVVRNRGITVLAATAALVGLLAASPVTRALRAFEDGTLTPMVRALAVAVASAALAATVAGALARRRA